MSDLLMRKAAEPLLDALVDRRVQSNPAGACLALALPHLHPDSRRRLVRALGNAYAAVLTERDSPHPVRVALRELLLGSDLLRRHVADLGPTPDALRHSELDPDAARRASEWFSAVELAHNRWRGRAVMADTLARMDEPSLVRAMQWLGDQAKREGAKNELVTRRARASRYALVRADPRAAALRVLRTGHNVLDDSEHAAVNMFFWEPGPGRWIVAKQRLRQQRVQLTAAKTGAGKMPLRGWLWFELKGVSPALTLCAPAEELDPTPCLPLAQLTIDAPATRVDADGVLQLRDDVPVRELMGLLDDRARLPLRVRTARLEAEQPVSMLFEAPEPLVWQGASPGQAGPVLTIRVSALGDQALFDVAAPDRRWLAAVDPRALGSFAIVTRGANGTRGSDGSSGRDGSPGPNGRNADCSNHEASDGGQGGNGGRGGDGGPGGRGGDGGAIRVLVACAEAECAGLTTLARAIVRSEPGEGGAGGNGGRGGRGGRGGGGGWGTPCDATGGRSTFHSPGSSGRSGLAGANGASGMNGAPGSAGPIDIQRAAPRAWAIAPGPQTPSP